MVIATLIIKADSRQYSEHATIPRRRVRGRIVRTNWWLHAILRSVRFGTFCWDGLVI